MHFSDLARTFDAIESTSARRELVAREQRNDEAEREMKAFEHRRRRVARGAVDAKPQTTVPG